MKIAITGYTSGIGKSLSKGFENQGHKIIGFNRSTSANISSDLGIDKIVDAVKDCDIFINNAYDTQKIRTTLGFAQTVLLYKIWYMWQGQAKIIINIGSRTSDVNHNKIWPYAIHKISLDEAVKQLRNLNTTRPQIINLKPGYVDTNQVSDISGVTKMDPNYIFDICNWAINQKHLIFDLSFEPRPQ